MLCHSFGTHIILIIHPMLDRRLVVLHREYSKNLKRTHQTIQNYRLEPSDGMKAYYLLFFAWQGK